MHKPPVLVIGASQAGVQLASSLREAGDTTPITLVGGDPHFPYQRPPLSKAYLAGKATEDQLLLRAPSWYAGQRIDVVTHEWVTGVEVDSTGAGSATTASGRTFEFGRLALTTGGTPRRLPVPGADLDNVVHLRSIADARALRQSLVAAHHVVVIGGGFIGLEGAAVARSLGKDVVVVEALDRLLARAVAPVTSDFYRDAHERRGTHFLLGHGVVELTGSAGAVDGVILADGTRLPADLVLVGIGLVPHTELAEKIGLRCDGGIVVDACARTSNPAIVAAGDCAILDDGSGRLVRVESVGNAIAQARVAAATLAGQPAPLDAVAWFWSDQADLKLQIAGLNTGYDGVVVRGEPASETFSALYYRGDQVIAVDAVNLPRDYLVVKKVLETGGNIPRDRAGDPEIALKALMTAPA